ncbi:ribosome biogenesis GTP-binding protein YihA/YsxC [Xanthovirga aplysinae]|uniref:ribosome biogenesis GTP-binding protein YihA/YsxC n=1 Tax=Xanthovirga aplysinae TaxID=2529853 RepID=UPI0012BC6497|nr:ribosome biogenesis GTP-binding protein YihA/YsxC [Xanthovirga aplysinae]MTI30937.1 YihA family ribosome biogenesis GTP-binding protein [Xanthovirga aplysinae]
MKIKNAKFVISNTDFKKCPPPNKPEYAFIGRSNVGKSSLINMLCDKQKLAKVSGKPGKTQLINHFSIDDKWYLVDLPGYGWAKVSKKEKEKWKVMVNQYLENRENLYCVFVLIDSRLDPQPIDLQFINYLGEKGLPFVLVFTKTDKQSINKSQAQIAKFKNEMLKNWEDLPDFFITSSVQKSGKEEILNFIEQTNKQA